MRTPCYCADLRMMTRRLANRYDASLAPVGINIAQYSLLRTIRRMQPVSLTALGRDLELDRSTLGRTVRVVEKLGLVELGQANDRRETSVSLTALGAERLEAATPPWQACQDSLAEELGPERLKFLSEITDLI